MSIWLWFMLSCKRQLKNKPFLVILFLLPICLFAMKQAERKDTGKIMIAVYTEEAGFGQELIERLKMQTGMFEFYQCTDQKELEAEVASNRAECGYVLTADLEKKLNEQNLKRLINVYSSPSTVAAKLSQEVVFSCLLEAYGSRILDQFIADNQNFVDLPQEKVRKELQNQFEHYYKNGSTFSFAYETLSAKAINQVNANISFPIRGVAAVYLMVTGLFGAVTLKQDEKKGLFIRVPQKLKLGCKLAVLFASVFLAGAAVFVSLILTGDWTTVSYEAGVLLLYIIVVVAFSYLCNVIIKNSISLCTLIPFLIIVSLVFCPIFIDVTKWMPKVQVFRYLLVPYYYLSFF